MTIESDKYWYGEAGTILANEYPGQPNIMTPTVLRTAMVGDQLAYELSEGRGIDDERIFGVTVVEVLSSTKTQRRSDLSDVFFSHASAERYIASLEK